MDHERYFQSETFISLCESILDSFQCVKILWITVTKKSKNIINLRLNSFE